MKNKQKTLMIGIRLRELRLDRGLTLEQLSDEIYKKYFITINKGTLSNYENGVHEPEAQKAMILAEYFGISYFYLMGDTDNPTGKTPKMTKTIPILGYIAAGNPILASEHLDGFEDVDDMDLDFCLRVKGDSMIGARIYDGDLVYVDISACVENGDIVVALVDGENATLKRFYKYENRIVLRAENINIKELEFNYKDKGFKILGKVKEVKFKV